MADREQVVVIGAGMGGLAAALTLAARGIAVTVLEAADTPGGKARAVPTAAGPANTGPTVLTMRGVLDGLFAACGTRAEDHVRLIALPRLARHFWHGGGQLDLFTDAEASASAIADFAGGREADGFRAFHRQTAALWQAFHDPVIAAPKPQLGRIAWAALRRPALWPALRPGASIDSLLRGHFRDPRLVQLFGRYATYVGGRPAHTPAVLALIWQAEAAGVWALAEGMHGLAQALARLAETQGVRFHYATRARRILRHQGRVAGVEVEGGATIACRACIFNGDPGALRDGLLGEAAQAALARSPRPKPSLSAWVWAFAAEAEGRDLAHHNLFFTTDPAQEFGPISKGQMPKAATLYLCAQDREIGDLAPSRASTPLSIPAPERFEIILNGPAGHQPNPQEEAQCRAITFPALARMGLSLTPPPPTQALTTPAMLSRRFPGSQGAIYGASPEGTLAAFRRPTARTDLPGLYLAGGGTHPGAGVPMALISGRQAALALAEDRISAPR